MTTGIIQRIDAIAKAEGGLSDARLEAVLLAEQERLEVAMAEQDRLDAQAERTSKSASAPTRADVFADTEKKARELHPDLSVAQAIDRLVKSEPGAYDAYTKAAETETDQAAMAVRVAKGRAEMRNWLQAERELDGLIDAYMHAHRDLNKAQAVTALMKSDPYAQQLYIRMRDHRDARVEREREEAVAKASSAWDTAVAAARASMPTATESQVLEAALRSPAGVEAAIGKHDGGASEREALLAQLHGLALEYQRTHEDVSYESAYAKVCQQGLGYHISQQLLKR
jgi:hypothetical protein